MKLPSGNTARKSLIIFVGLVILSMGLWFWFQRGNHEFSGPGSRSPLSESSRPPGNQAAANGQPGISDPNVTPTSSDPNAPVSAPLLQLPRRVENGYTVLDWPSGKPFVRGEEIVAYFECSASGKKFKGSPNQIGKYPKVFLGPEEPVEVRLEFPESPPETPVAVWQEDGGQIGTEQEVVSSTKLELDGARTASFRFTPTAQQGNHRVIFHTPGGQHRILEFWVGAEQIYAPKES